MRQIHPDDQTERDRHAREQNILTVQKEMKGEYWPLLRAKLEDWIAKADKRRMDLIDSEINEKVIRALNDEKIKIELLVQMLRINDAIIYENKTLLDRMKEKILKIKEYVPTFVGNGRNHEEE